MPVVESLDELNEKIRRWEAQDDHRRITDRIHTVGEDFAAEQAFLAPLPMETFDPGLVMHPRVDRSALVTVRMVRYLVPAHLIGRRVRVSLRASEVVIFDGRTTVARHQRVIARGGASIQLDHYLEVLRVKPGALPGSTALAAARKTGLFTAAHEAFWSASRRVNGDTAGTQQLVDVLLLHRSMTDTEVTAGIEAALQVGAVTADVVAVEARRYATTHAADTDHDNGSGTGVGGAGRNRHDLADRVARTGALEQRVVSLTQRRLTDPAAVIAGLPPDLRPVPSVDAYDELLPRRTRPTTSAAADGTPTAAHT